MFLYCSNSFSANQALYNLILLSISWLFQKAHLAIKTYRFVAQSTSFQFLFFLRVLYSFYIHFFYLVALQLCIISLRLEKFDVELFFLYNPVNILRGLGRSIGWRIWRRCLISIGILRALWDVWVDFWIEYLFLIDFSIIEHIEYVFKWVHFYWAGIETFSLSDLGEISSLESFGI